MATVKKFNFTGAVQTFTVPDQVTSITAELVGGLPAYGASGPPMPGYVKATFPVTPGQILSLYVGGNGAWSPGTGGWNGGGAGGTGSNPLNGRGGGGASDIRIGGTALSNRVLVAGGSGGEGGFTSMGGNDGPLGGKGGATTGGTASKGFNSAGTLYSAGATGGTQAAGGAGGTGAATGAAGTSGTGGAGANRGSTGASGGGGGGGYYGGGGGGSTNDYPGQAGGGGGGSNFIAATINGSAPTSTVNTQGYAVAYPYGASITLTYDTKPTLTPSFPDTTHSVSTASPIGNFTAVHDDDNGGAPTYYQLIVEDNSTGTVVFDSTKTAAGAGTYDILAAKTVGYTYTVHIPQNISAFCTANTQYRWKMRTWDSAGLVSDYTAYTVFKYKDAPTFTISPPDATVLGNGKPTVSWNDVAFSMGGSQSSRRVRFIRQSDSAVMYDSGVSNTTSTSLTPSSDVLPNGASYTAEVTVTGTDGLSTIHTVTYTTVYAAPASINYTVNPDNVDDFGYVLIDWSSAASDPAWNSWRVYRKASEDSDWTLLFETLDIGVHQYYDFLVKSQETYQYTVVQTALVSGTPVESPPGYKAGGIIDGSVYFIKLLKYWIIDTINPALSTYIPNVTSGAMTEQYEEETYTVIGRGQKKDYGTRLGYNGTLSAQLRGVDGTPQMIRSKVEEMRAAQDTYYLRTPQGDLFTIGLGDCEFSPLAGVGDSVMYDATIPFSEVAGEIVDEQVNVTVVVKYVLENATAVDNGDETTTVTLS